MRTPRQAGTGEAGPSVFGTTQWSVIVAARDERSDAALETLCRSYWPAIYRFIRREGYLVAEAQDLTQEFFARLLARDFLQHLRHREGRFRSFLLAFLEHFLSDERDRVRALKRGGGRPVISLDEFTEEERRRIEPVDAGTPERQFECRWVLALLERAIQRLRDEYVAKGQGALFEAVKDLRPGERGSMGYAELARLLGGTEASIKTAVHRLRRRHHEILREEVARTVGHPSEVDAEIRHLLRVLDGSG